MSLVNKDLVDYIRNSKRILIFTGAGVSTPSGIPDFRGPQGVWKQRMPVYYQDFMASEQARIEYWDYKLEGEKSYKNAQPNPVHQGCVTVQNAGKLECVVTQNIDGLHARAGLTSEKLVELHGTNAAVECQSCGVRSDPEPHYVYFEKFRKPPLCQCGGFLKPATISFGQSLRDQDLNRAFSAAQKADLVLSLGSTLSVYPAAAVPLVAAERGVPYIIINRGRTDHDELPVVHLRLDGDVSDLFVPAVTAACSTPS